MKIETTFLRRCTATLEKAFDMMQTTDKESIDYDLYRSAVIKEFEIILEQSGKLLKKCLNAYFHSSKEVDRLMFRDIFRHAGRYGLLSLEEVDRWLMYRDIRNKTAHDYGLGLAEETLPLLARFIEDAKTLAETIDRQNDFEK